MSGYDIGVEALHPFTGEGARGSDDGASAASRSCSPESLRHALAGSIASQACITLRPGIAIRATTPESGNDRQTLRPRLRAQPRADPRGAARTFRQLPPRARSGTRHRPARGAFRRGNALRSEEHTSELQSLMRISYAVFCLKKKTTHNKQHR